MLKCLAIDGSGEPTASIVDQKQVMDIKVRPEEGKSIATVGGCPETWPAEIVQYGTLNDGA